MLLKTFENCAVCATVAIVIPIERSIKKKMTENSGTKMRRRTIGTVAQRVIRIRRQSRYGRPIQAVWKVFSEYSETSTVHGVRYLGERRRHWSERIWWIITVSVSVFLCFVFILQAWWRWHTSPVIITFADEATPISNIPFPTLTICNDVMVNTSVFNYTYFYDKLNSSNYKDADLDLETIRKVHSLTNFCWGTPQHLQDYMQYKNFTVDRNILPYLRKVTPNITDIINSGFCTLATSTRRLSCKDILTPTLTDYGYCYTFNQMSSNDIYNTSSLADDFPKNGGLNTMVEQMKNFTGGLENVSLTYPYRVGISGKGVDIRFNMSINDTEKDILCSSIIEGFKIQIHSGDEIPRMRERYYHIPFDHDVRILVRPNLMVTSPSLIKNYEQDKRKCIDKNEHSLQFFQQYTQRNCLLDVLAVKMADTCKCVQFWMPRANDTKICYSQANFQCIQFVQNEIYNASMTNKCLPVCDSVTYDAEISVSKMKVEALRRFVKGGNRIIRVTVSFKDQQYFASHRSELYDTMDFIASCGGILSLFMGISLLSFVEIIYFATLRLSCKLHKRKLAKKRMEAQQNAIDCLDVQTG